MSEQTIALPESSNNCFVHLQLTTDGKFLATSNSNLNSEKAKDIWFYEFVDNQLLLHSNILGDAVISRDIDVSQLAAGCYFIRIIQGEHTEMHKVIKL